MTEQELQSVINAALSSIKTNSRSIGQLTGVQTLSDSDCFEVAGGRKIAYSVLRDLIFAAANTKLENMQTDIANSVLQSVSFDAKSSTATLTIKQKGHDAISVSVPIATDSQSGFMTAEQVKYIDDLREDIPNLQNKLDAAHGEVMIADLDKLCTADDMLQGKPACYTVLDTLVTTKGTVTLKVGVLWVYSDNLRHVVMQVLNTNFVLDDDGTFTGRVHNHDVHEYSRTYAYSTAAGTLHTWSKWQEVGGKGIVDRITNVALAKQNKLTAGDDATRLNGAKLSTKQIFTGSIDTTAGAVPMLLPVGGCIYNSADKKLYIGDSNSQPVEVAKPNDFLFFSNGKLYHYQFGNFGEVETGTTLVAGDGATRINASALSTKQIYRGTVININGVPQGLAVGAYCFNTETKKLYVGAQHDNAMVTDTVPMPDDFLFVDTASGTTYRCDGTTLHNIDNIKTVNGQSLLGKGNVQLTGADFLLEQGAGLTINEAVNSNTDALKNKLGKASIAQTTGQATDKVMSQKSVTDALDFPRVTLKVTYLTEVIKGKSVGVNGTLYNQAYHEVTCHIPCEGAHKVEIIIGAPSSSTWLLAAFYDADGKFLNTCTVYGGAKRTFTSPATSAYLVATYIADTTNERGVWIDGVKVHEPVPDDIEVKHTGGDKEYYLMSQKGVHDYVNQRLMDSTQSHTTFGSGFCYRLNARQIELLEASDVITLEICGQINGGLNGYNNTAGMQYFDINFGNNHARFQTTNDGAYAFTGDSKLNPFSGPNWQLAATQTGVEPRMPNDRVLMVIDRKQGIVRLYDKCSRKIIECQRDAYKCDSWLAGDDWLAIMSRAKDSYVADLWAIRIYDRDVTILQYDNSFRVKDAHMTEAILPFQRPIITKNIDVKDWQIEKFDKATMDKNYGRPYNFTKTYSYDPDDGLLTGTNDTTDWVMIGPGSSNAGNLYGIIDVDFEVTGGKWRVAKKAAIKVYSITKADGTDMGIEGIFSYSSNRTELEAGRYTMSYISFSANAFCDIAPGAKIKMHSMHQHTLHCVANINPRYYCNGQCWDDARQEWWTPLDVNNHSTPVVPTFSDAAWRSVPAPALLSQPSFNGQLKIDDSGKVYVGVVMGATRTWKQINNT